MSTQHLAAAAQDVGSDLDSFEGLLRKREWNRAPLIDLFPRLPPKNLEPLLDLLIAKAFVYNLSESRYWNSRRYTSIVVAHVRHQYTDYDALLRGCGEKKVERYEAREKTAGGVWKVLREWCPWDESNPVLERCLRATLVRPEARGEGWDPMDVDVESDVEFDDDPMDLD